MFTTWAWHLVERLDEAASDALEGSVVALIPKSAKPFATQQLSAVGATGIEPVTAAV